VELFQCAILTCFTLNLVFNAVGVAVFIVYHFVLFCRLGTQNNLPFLNTKPNLNLTKKLSVLLMDSDVGKMSDFDNI